MPLSEYDRQVLAQLDVELSHEAPHVSRLMRSRLRMHRPMDGLLLACVLLPGSGLLLLAAFIGSSGLMAIFTILMRLGYYGATL